MMLRPLYLFASLFCLSQPVFAQVDVSAESDVIMRRGIGMMPGPRFGEIVKDSPVSARMTNRMVRELCDGNRIVHEHVTLIYRDASGRVRREHSTAHAGTGNMIMITDPIEQQTWMLEAATKTAYKSHMFDRRIGAVQGFSYNRAQPLHESATAIGPIAPMNFTVGGPVVISAESFVSVGGMGPMGAGQTAVDPLGQDTIDGVRVEGTAYTTTYPANMFGNELPIVVQKTTWYAPELQMLLRSEEKDPRMGTVTFTTEILSVEEPDPVLFEIPADYQIIEPAMAEVRAPVE